MEFLIVSGMSGAGKSRAAAVFEDLGYYCVDNMPAALIPKFAEMCIAAKGRYSRVVLVTDVRGADFDTLFDALGQLRSLGCEYKILFFEASTETIISRQKENRRKHPLQTEGMSMQEAVELEHAQLAGVRARADYIINTTKLTTAELRQHLISLFPESGMRDRSICVNVMSFGFKYGVPPEADFMVDVRFLPNPFYLPELRPHTGLSEDVRDYVMSNPRTQDFLEHLYQLLDFLIPQYVEEGKTTLVIAIGCTGGKHRSVALAEAVNTHICELKYRSISLHRDIKRR